MVCVLYCLEVLSYITRSSAKTIPNECDGMYSTVEKCPPPALNGTLNGIASGTSQTDNKDPKCIKIPCAMLRYTDKPDKWGKVQLSNHNHGTADRA